MATTFGRTVYISKFKEAREAIAKQAAARAVYVGQAARDAIVKGMQEPKTGRLYRVPGTRVMYRASAPGEYPAIRTGALRASIKSVFKWDKTNQMFSAFVGTHLLYGMFLELGTRTMARRPWLSRGLRDARAKIMKIIQTPWKL